MSSTRDLPRRTPPRAGAPRARRRFLGALCAVWVTVGAWGAWSYGHDYYRYRGFAPPSNPVGVPAGRLVQQSFFSPALGARRTFDVYLPPGYAADRARGRRFGVMYLLHGSPGWPRLFMNVGALGVAMDTLIQRHAFAPFLVVMPDGRDGSLLGDTEWADTPHGRYESFVLDTVRAADRLLPTIPDREHRVLAGNSAGAYGAANLTLRHLGTFSAFQAWSGYYRQTPTGVFRKLPAAALRANSPIDYVAGLRPVIAKRPVQAYLYGGAKDPDTVQLAPFAAALRAAGGRVTARVLPGGHDWRLWRAQTPAMLRWAGEVIDAPACRPGLRTPGC